MRRHSRHAVLVIVLAAAAALAGCASGFPPEEARTSESTETETRINEAAVPGTPMRASVSFAGEVEQVDLDVSLTNLENDPQSANGTITATVVVLAGDTEIFRETYDLSGEYDADAEEVPDSPVPGSPGKATQIVETFGASDLQMTGGQQVVDLVVTVEGGRISVDGYLRANFFPSPAS